MIIIIVHTAQVHAFNRKDLAAIASLFIASHLISSHQWQ